MGEWDAYVDNSPAYYDTGGFFHGDVRIIEKRSRIFASVNGDLRYVNNSRIPHENRDGALLLIPSDKNSGLKVIQELGYKLNTIRWDAFNRLLDELAKPRYRVLTLRNVPTLTPDPNRVTVFIRHDVDRSLFGAHAMAWQEHLRELPATYFINLAAALYGLTAEKAQYCRRPGAVEDIIHLQSLGHEIGYHTDILIMALMYDIPMRPWLDQEIGHLKEAGVRITSQAEHGSKYCSKIKAHNCYSYTDFRKNGSMQKLYKDYPNGFDGVVEYIRNGRKLAFPIPGIYLKDAGFTVSSYVITKQLPFTPKECDCFSDTSIKSSSTAKELDDLFLNRIRAVQPGAVVQMLLHPCRWTTDDPACSLSIISPVTHQEAMASQP